MKICIADRLWKILGVWHKYSPTSKWLKNKYLYLLLTFTLPCDIIIMLLNTTLHRGIAQPVEQRSPKPRVVSSILTAPAILVILNSCTPFKARIYGLYLHFRDENFKVKTMAVFSRFLRRRRIRTDAEGYLGKIQGVFEKNNFGYVFFNIKIVYKVLKTVLSNITN